jgi:Tol biopolymer transport system component
MIGTASHSCALTVGSVTSAKRILALLAVTGTMLSVVVVSGGGSARATMPGANGGIAFSLDKGSGGEIYTIEADGTDLTRLTYMDGNAIAPDWSPDGSRIAFWLEDQALYTMGADGSELQEVTTLGGQAAFTPPTANTSSTSPVTPTSDRGSSSCARTDRTLRVSCWRTRSPSPAMRTRRCLRTARP